MKMKDGCIIVKFIQLIWTKLIHLLLMINKSIFKKIKQKRGDTMAIAKDIPETYFCETDADRNRIYCYAGQKCIMVNGDIYICITDGVWHKIGEELCAAIFMVEGKVYLSEVYTKGSSVPAPANPSVADGTFNGWKVGAETVTFPYTLSVDTTFVADIVPTPTPPTPTGGLDIDIPPEAFESGFCNIENGGFRLDSAKSYISQLTYSDTIHDSMLPAYPFNGTEDLGVDKLVIASMVSEELGIYIIDGVQITEMGDEGIVVVDNADYSGIILANEGDPVTITHITVSEFEFDKDYDLEIMSDVKYTVEGYNYGYTETGALDLVVGTTYTANADFYYRQEGEDYPFVVSATGECKNNYDSLDVNYIEFGASLNYLTVIDNAKWEAPAQEGSEPTLVAAQGCVAFKGNFNQGGIQFTIGIDITE